MIIDEIMVVQKQYMQKHVRIPETTCMTRWVTTDQLDTLKTEQLTQCLHNTLHRLLAGAARPPPSPATPLLHRQSGLPKRRQGGRTGGRAKRLWGVGGRFGSTRSSGARK
jgi:hypothetical protein